MSDAPKKPKMEFEVNIPTVVKLIKMFKEGESEYGRWFGYSVEHDGVEKTLFANEQLQKELEGYKGSVQITKKQIKNSSGEGYHNEWVVREAILDNSGRVTEAPPPDIRKDDEARNNYREQRKRFYKEALVDAADLVIAYNSWVTEKQLPSHFLMNHEDIRSIATSFAIQFERASR